MLDSCNVGFATFVSAVVATTGIEEVVGDGVSGIKVVKATSDAVCVNCGLPSASTRVNADCVDATTDGTRETVSDTLVRAV
jgi:hypothetical protein